MIEKNKDKYVHLEEAHNLDAPSVIVPYIMETIQPESVVDVGCGIGTFLAVFRKYGVTDIRGYDGHWVKREQLREYIDEKYFIEADLEGEIKSDRRFDLAVCLEVAEHLHETSADTLVKTLTSFSDIILFSAAIPGQMGQNHINEQWPDYWQEKFTKAGFYFYDKLRPVFWDNELLPRWYKQNMFLLVKEGREDVLKAFSENQRSMLNIVHPEYFSTRVRELKQLQKDKKALQKYLEEIVNGKAPIKTYLKMILKKMVR